MYRSNDTQLKMQQVDLLVAQGLSIEAAAREVGVSQPAYILWLHEHNDAVPVPVDRLMHLQSEVSRLRKTLAQMSLELSAAKRLQRYDAFEQALAA